MGMCTDRGGIITVNAACSRPIHYATFFSTP